MGQPDKPAPLHGQLGSDDLSAEPSIVRGGPFYRTQEALRLLTPEDWRLRTRILIAIAVGWLPLVLLTLLSKPGTIEDLLRDYTVNVRMLIDVPVLLIGQLVMENIFRRTFHHLRAADLLAPPEKATMDTTISRLIRLSNSSLIEATLVILAYVNVLSLGGRLAIAESWMLGNLSWVHLSLAGWYYVLVSQLIFRFLIGLSLWKWLLWIGFLFRLSRLKMQLIPTHPDKHGGIGFLGLSPLAIAPTIFVICGAIGSTWRTQILEYGAHLMSFKINALVLLAIMLIVAVGPLALFIPKLAQLRRHGILEYGILGQIHSSKFHEKWVLNRTGHEDEFLTAPEISSLIDYASSYENVENLQPLLLDRTALIGLVASIVIPLLPTVVAEIPLMTVIKGLLDAVK